MNSQNLQDGIEKLKAFLLPLNDALKNPEKAQQAVLMNLISHYSQTDFGRNHNVSQVKNVEDFRTAFPVRTYEDLRPSIERVMKGETQVLLSEKAIGWAITRGTTKGESKFIPMTPTDLQMRTSAGRAIMNFILSKKRFDILQGINLNLNFPSTVGKIRMGDRDIEYGYSSGIYVKHVSASTPIRSLPHQDDIDALGGGKSLADWEARFELAYQKCKKENVTLVGGVAPTAVEFGKYLKKKHSLYPKDLWKVQIMTLGSVPGINTTYKSQLQAMYGPAVIREIYGATEGMFGQQLDESRAWVPNYDLFFLEVHTRKGIKMLYEMKPGEMGSLIVSTVTLPRYKIGDLIRAYQPPYFRCVGRDTWWTPFVYAWKELMSFNLDRL